MLPDVKVQPNPFFGFCRSISRVPEVEESLQPVTFLPAGKADPSSGRAFSYPFGGRDAFSRATIRLVRASRIHRCLLRACQDAFPSASSHAVPPPPAPKKLRAQLAFGRVRQLAVTPTRRIGDGLGMASPGHSL
jgi:hypothetical protein